MSAFDEFISGAKKCLDYATEKTEQAFDYSKKQVQKSQLICKLKEEYESLGKLCYDTSEMGADNLEKMNQKIINIRHIRDEIDLIRSQMKKNSSFTCQTCGYTAETKYEYCSKCGAKL